MRIALISRKKSKEKIRAIREIRVLKVLALFGYAVKPSLMPLHFFMVI